MKRCLIILLLLSGAFFNSKVFAQQVYSDSTQLKISDLEDRITDLESTNSDLSATVEKQKKQIAKIDSQLTVNQSTIQHIADSLNITNSKVSDVDKQTQTQITGLNQSLSAKSRFWLIAILVLAVISFIVFLILRRKLTSSTAELGSKITQTNETLLSESQKVDSKLTEIEKSNELVDSKLTEIEKSNEIVDSKLEEIQKTNVSLHYESILLGSKLGEIAKTTEVMQIEGIKHDTETVVALTKQMAELKEERSGKDEKGKIDHKQAKKIGEEVYRIKKRIEILPRKIKGITALRNSLFKVELEFIEAGYTIEEMLGEKYNPEAKVEAKFIDNPDIIEGHEIITDVIRPQISYKSKVIQTAKVEVSKHPDTLIAEKPTAAAETVESPVSKKAEAPVSEKPDAAVSEKTEAPIIEKPDTSDNKK